MKTIYLLLLLAPAIFGCKKDSAKNDVIDEKKYDAVVTLTLDRRFFGNGDDITGFLSVSQENSDINIDYSNVYVKYLGKRLDISGGEGRFIFNGAKESEDKIIIDVEYVDGKIVSEEFNVTILPSSKATDLLGSSKKEQYQDWISRVGDAIVNIIKVDEPFKAERSSDYFQARTLNIFPFKGLIGVTYVYFDDNDILREIRIAHGGTHMDPNISLFEIYQDVSTVYGEGEFSENNESFTITSGDVIITTKAEEQYFNTTITKKQ